MRYRAAWKWIAVAGLLLAAGLAPLPQQGVDLRIGSKKFTESVILGEMLRLLLDDQGIRTAHYPELGGTRLVFEALLTGQIDAYPEYTGTIAEEILAGRGAIDAEAMRALLQEQGIVMSQPLGFSNNYALALRRDRAEELGVSRISDLKRWPELRLAVTHEFLDRGDGWPALKRRYSLPQRSVAGVDHDLAYRQLQSGEIDVIDVYTTDAMIRRGDLVLLEDDLEFFPRYDAVWLYRADAAQGRPELAAAVKRLEGALDEDAMRTLNDAVVPRQLNEEQAAAGFLNEQIGLQLRRPEISWPRMIVRHVMEHLNLVRHSLLPAIVAGVALGVVCQRFARLGRVVMLGVGLLQTIPSLALLVLLLPIVAALGYRSVGEGSVTAIVALFCYCLLPIVRNTHAGLNGISQGTIESATVLGLSPVARLTEIELPIALPTLLAGIRVAAVQNVGFATLGAIIGAGGLGQPILRGIRLNDVPLILAGAIPAALLAVALQGGIDAAERFVIPRGLRRPVATD